MKTYPAYLVKRWNLDVWVIASLLNSEHLILNNLHIIPGSKKLSQAIPCSL